MIKSLSILYNIKTDTYWLYDRERQTSFFCDSTGKVITPGTQCLKWETLTEAPSDVIQAAIENKFDAAREYILKQTIELYPEIEGN